MLLEVKLWCEILWLFCTSDKYKRSYSLISDKNIAGDFIVTVEILKWQLLDFRSIRSHARAFCTLSAYFKFPILILDSSRSAQWLWKSNIHNVTRATFNLYLRVGFLEWILRQWKLLYQRKTAIPVKGGKLQETVVPSRPQCRTVPTWI